MTDYNATTQAAAANARELIRRLIQDSVPNADVTEGSVLSDLLVDGVSVPVSFLLDRIEELRNTQSILRLKNLPETQSVSDAADALLSNLFWTRAQGKFAKGSSTLLFSQRIDVLVPRNARFFRTATHVFYLDSATDLFIPASDLFPVLDGNGIVTSYGTNVFLTAARVGTDYNIDRGRFAGYDRFNALLVGVKNDLPFEGGFGVQSTTDFVDGAQNAMSLRAMVNARSNDSLLRSIFDTLVARTVTIGAGDPEMRRDLVPIHGSSAAMHVGGHVDVFVLNDVREVVDRLTVGALYRRNDGRPLILRHSIGTPSGSFIAAGVRPGHILRVDGGVSVPGQYRILAVRDDEIEIVNDVPFSNATDEIGTPPALSYSIGTNYPEFDNKVAATTTVNAVTSALFAQPNRVELDAVPAHRIKRVEVLAPLPVDLEPYADPSTGNVIFTAQKNAPILGTPAVGDELGYFVEVLNPLESSSSKAVTMLEVGWRSINLEGATVQVTYDTPYAFSQVDAYVSDRNIRNSNSNLLLRAMFPVYIYATIPYKQRTTPINPLSANVPIFDDASAQAALQTYITAYRELEALDAQLLGAKTREASGGAATIYEFKVYYTLPLPDGRLMQFETKDAITVFPDETSSTAKLLNPADFGLPSTGYARALRVFLEQQGISDRVTRYFAAPGSIVFERRS